jgi:cyclopropane fatty-acyl-phospholipid synthase-like methyltransferase
MLNEIKSTLALFNRNGPNFYDITKYGYEQYQDIVINNVVVKKASGNHETEIRYKIIQEVLNKYRRRFEMLDIGASQGYYSFRAAHDYDCVCVMIEGNNPSYPRVGKQLFDLCKMNDSLKNLILLNKQVIPEDLQKLSECESFSVVLALNIIHWLGPRWKETTDAILNLGDNIIIETPPQESHASPEENNLRKLISAIWFPKMQKF